MTSAVLDLGFRPHPYAPGERERIERWIGFFAPRVARLWAVAPVERAADAPRPEKAARWELLPAASFDSCDRWRAGLLRWLAAAAAPDARAVLWSADFDFTPPAREAADALLATPGDADLRVGTIDASGAKEAVDRLATGPLLAHWFPEEAARMADAGLARPRSELLRLGRTFAASALAARWYPTEQTLHLILQCLWSEGRFRAEALALPALRDDDANRAGTGIVEQVERMELWLRYLWRGRNPGFAAADYLARCEESARIALGASRALLDSTSA